MKLTMMSADVTKIPGNKPVRMEAVVERATGDVVTLYEINEAHEIIAYSIDDVYDYKPVKADWWQPA